MGGGGSETLFFHFFKENSPHFLEYFIQNNTNLTPPQLRTIFSNAFTIAWQFEIKKKKSSYRWAFDNIHLTFLSEDVLKWFVWIQCPLRQRKVEEILFLEDSRFLFIKGLSEIVYNKAINCPRHDLWTFAVILNADFLTISVVHKSALPQKPSTGTQVNNTPKVCSLGSRIITFSRKGTVHKKNQDFTVVFNKSEDTYYLGQM